MNKHHDIGNIQFDGDFVELTIDGSEKRFELKKISPLLHKATEMERNTLEVSPSGYGIHWPLLDEDISIDALLGIANAPSGKRKTG
jgi:hypothetical protein